MFRNELIVVADITPNVRAGSFSASADAESAAQEADTGDDHTNDTENQTGCADTLGGIGSYGLLAADDRENQTDDTEYQCSDIDHIPPSKDAGDNAANHTGDGQTLTGAAARGLRLVGRLVLRLLRSLVLRLLVLRLGSLILRLLILRLLVLRLLVLRLLGSLVLRLLILRLLRSLVLRLLGSLILRLLRLLRLLGLLGLLGLLRELLRILIVHSALPLSKILTGFKLQRYYSMICYKSQHLL